MKANKKFNFFLQIETKWNENPTHADKQFPLKFAHSNLFSSEYFIAVAFIHKILNYEAGKKSDPLENWLLFSKKKTKIKLNTA